MKNNPSLKKKLLMYALILVAIVVIVVIVISLLGNATSFSEIESTMKAAGKEYYSVHNYLLPENVGDSTSVTATELAEAKFMKPLTSYNKKASLCSGQVFVKKVTAEEYMYTSELDCGSLYTSIPFYKKLTNTDNVTSSGDGLYNVGSEYIFRGDNPSNYVEYGGNYWRIVKVTQDNYVMLILNKSLEGTYVWDNRYNVEVGNTSGINDYSISRLKSSFSDLYDGTTLLTAKAKENVVPSALCIGKRYTDDDAKDNSIECQTKDTPQYIGTITASDFLMASLDANCKTTIDISCLNYNYLNQYSKDYWTLTGSVKKSEKAYLVKSRGSMESVTTSSSASIRPTILLNESVKLSSGTGTYSDPYILK